MEPKQITVIHRTSVNVHMCKSRQHVSDLFRQSTRSTSSAETWLARSRLRRRWTETKSFWIKREEIFFLLSQRGKGRALSKKEQLVFGWTICLLPPIKGQLRVFCRWRPKQSWKRGNVVRSRGTKNHWWMRSCAANCGLTDGRHGDTTVTKR